MKTTDLMKKMRAVIAAEVLFAVISYVFMGMIPYFNKYLVDNVLVSAGNGFVLLCAAYVGAYLLYLFFTRLSERFSWKKNIMFTTELKNECFNKILDFPYKKFRQKENGEYISFLTNNINALADDYLVPRVAMVKDILWIAVYLGLIIYTTNIYVCVLLVLGSVLSALSPEIYKNILKKRRKDYTDGLGKYNSVTEDLLCVHELANKKVHKNFLLRYENITDAVAKRQWKFGKVKVDSLIISGGSFYIIQAVMFIALGYFCLRGNITLGVVIAGLTYANSFSDPIEDLLYCINTINSTKDILDEVDEYLSFAADTEADPQKSFDDSLELRNVKVDFDSRELFYNVRADSGNKYIINDSNGSGKTTFFNVLMGYQDYSGEILIDDEQGLMDTEKVYYLSQHQHVLKDSFYNNVSLYGSYGFDVAELENIFSEVIGFRKITECEDCTQLSGGEQQILKFCRMYVQNKPFVLLDEPFSAMDEHNENALMKILGDMDSTVLLVSHHKYDFPGWKKLMLR